MPKRPADFGTGVSAKRARLQLPTLAERDEGFLSRLSGVSEASAVLVENVQAPTVAANVDVNAAGVPVADPNSEHGVAGVADVEASLAELPRRRRANIIRVLLALNEQITPHGNIERLRARSAAFFRNLELTTGVDMMASGDHHSLRDIVFAMHIHFATCVNGAESEPLSRQALRFVIYRIQRFYGRAIIENMLHGGLLNGDDEGAAVNGNVDRPGARHGL